ncbi:4232_t:CDS:2 [Dentiscutata erythropus]|uniref:4232_t:CDS:1 n=1 Tax=Dentiscutata erythropus TaxID=1348616 RepID=A0A9N8W7Q3_9GLOM|nr:4232_t:CDS:2 [Dentiscutata erythropus]
MSSRSIYFYASTLIALVLLNSHSSLGLNNYTDSSIDCSSITSCGECTSHLECGFCVSTSTCVQAGWKGPFKHPSACPSWDYEYAQCFVTHKQALISLISALVGSVFILLLLCFCCCLCRCCRFRNNDEERVPLLGDTIATHHFRRASYYNYNRNRPFERRGRTLSSGTANSTMQYGRNWRNGTDEYMYGYGGPTTPSMLWVNDSPVPTDYPMGSHNSSLGNNGEWRRWEKKREELLAKYAKSNNEG